MASSTASASKLSCTTKGTPRWTNVSEQIRPLTWANGNGDTITSSDEMPTCLQRRSVVAASVSGVCATNLGWPVVPDVLISTAGSYEGGTGNSAGLLSRNSSHDRVPSPSAKGS